MLFYSQITISSVQKRKGINYFDLGWLGGIRLTLGLAYVYGNVEIKLLGGEADQVS